MSWRMKELEPFVVKTELRGCKIIWSLKRKLSKQFLQELMEHSVFLKIESVP